MSFSSRGSFSRDSSTGPFHRESSRDGKFDDAPNSNKFPMPQTVPSGSVNGLGRGAQAMGPHSNRPTDPRRRPSKDMGHSPAPFGMKTDQGINDGTGNPINADSRHLTGAPSGGPPFSDVSTIPPAPHPARRTSSYSSLQIAPPSNHPVGDIGLQSMNGDVLAQQWMPPVPAAYRFQK